MKKYPAQYDIVKTILVVAGPNDWVDSLRAVSDYGAALHVVEKVETARTFFNGESPHTLVVSATVPGAREFVQSVRHSHKMRIISLSEETLTLSDVGCNCFVRRDRLTTSVIGFLGWPPD